MTLTLLFVLTAFASFRLTRIVVGDTWYPTERFRDWLKTKKAKNEDRQSAFEPGTPLRKRYAHWTKFWTEIGELFTCPWCFGWWISGLMVLIVDIYVGIPLPLLWWPAVSTVVGYLGTYDGS